jgi:glycosyltransferase involved in cell wall biosynthesis
VTDIAVVIAARDPGLFLVEALASVAVQTQPPAATVLVDDGSSVDDLAALSAGHPGLVLVRQDPTGRAAARNRGAEATDAGLLLFLDADDRLRPGALAALAAALEAAPAAELVHGRTWEFADEQLPPGEGVRAPAGEIAVRLGGATLLRRSLWDRIGPLDESLPRGEWIEWMHRAYDGDARAIEIDDVILERRLHSGNRTTGDGGKEHYVLVARAALARRRAAGAGPTTP